MLYLYRKWIQDWERDLATRDTNRIVRPFDWGAEWMDGVARNPDPARGALEFVRTAIGNSDAFFSGRRPADYRLDGAHLTFTSPVTTPYPENNTVHGQFFPAPKDGGRAVLVLPQWNSDFSGHVGLCRLLNRFGVTALRMSMAYHDRRKPPEIERADYHLSSNVGRTIHAARQSVIDARACIDWLEDRGYQRIGILGTSLGSCIAFITTAHDRRIRSGVFNHVSLNFGDVVWTGFATQHVRKSLEQRLNQSQLREYWSVISPATYLGRLSDRELSALLVWARFDTTFLPEFSKKVLEYFRDHKLRHEVFCLPCAHYTTGKFPFNLMDGIAICRFLSRYL